MCWGNTSGCVHTERLDLFLACPDCFLASNVTIQTTFCRSFKMSFKSDFCGCVSVQTLWTLTSDFPEDLFCHSQHDTQRQRQTWRDGGESEQLSRIHAAISRVTWRAWSYAEIFLLQGIKKKRQQNHAVYTQRLLIKFQCASDHNVSCRQKEYNKLIQVIAL